MLQSISEIPPRCTKCGAVMEQANVQPGLGLLANRIFICKRCGTVELAPQSKSST